MKRKKVLLMIETSLNFGREVLRGITQYLISQRHWSVWLDMRELMVDPPEWLKSWDGDGVITRSATPELISLLRKMKLPAVNLTDVHGNRDLPHLWVDHAQVGKLAAQHLLERGFKHFGFCGFGNHDWSHKRLAGFLAALPHADRCSVFESDWLSNAGPTWEEQQSALIAWLQSLPRPVGIMACNDLRGQHVLDACRRADLAVPEEIAVLGVDNDELICDLCDPPLSSVIVNPRKVGFEAAQMLDRLMNGQIIESPEILVEPIGVRARQSTDVLAIDHTDVAAALRMIREQACAGLTVPQLVRKTRLSRSVLERLFRKYLRHSPQQEIRLTQLKRVKELLVETDLPLAEIAGSTGFRHSEYLSVVFKRELGMTPGEYRRSVSGSVA